MRPTDSNRSRARSTGSWWWVLLGVWLALAWAPAWTCYAQSTPPAAEENDEEAQNEAEPAGDEEESGESEAEASQPESDDTPPAAEEADEAGSNQAEEPGAEEAGEAGADATENGEEPGAGQGAEAAEAEAAETGEGTEQPRPGEEAQAGPDKHEKPRDRSTGEVEPRQDDKSRQQTARERAAERRRQAAERAKQRKAPRGEPQPTEKKPPGVTPTPPAGGQAPKGKASEREKSLGDREPQGGPAPKGKASDREKPRGFRQEGKPEAQESDRAKPEKTPPTGEPEPVVDIEIEEPDFGIPPEERTYQFSFENVEYAELLDAFSRMSGLAIIGDPPEGKVTFKTTEVMDFKAAFNRIRLLLFRHRDIYWMRRKGNDLEVARVTDITREIEVDHFYPNVAAFRGAADRDENDLVMLLYMPERGSADDLMLIRDFLPDYVRMAPLDDPTQNKMTVFALVKDIDKFLDLVDIFFKDDDPRVVKKIPVLHVTPTEAINALAELMDLSGRAAAAPGGKGRKEAAAPAGATREIKLLPVDEQEIILVRALPSDIEEIERLLPFIDVDVESLFNPVIIELKYTTAEKIVEQMRPLLGASGGEAAPSPARKEGKRGGEKTAPRPGRSPGGTAGDIDVTVVPEPRTNTLIVLGSDDGIARVRQIVALLDVPSGMNEPAKVELQYAKAAELSAKLATMVQQARPETTFTVTPEEGSNSLYLLGTAPDLELARGLIKEWDVPPPTLHKTRVTYAKASDVATMLFNLESGQPQAQAQPAATPPPPGGKGKASRPPRRAPGQGVARSGKFLGEDATNIVYVLCTDVEWENEYLPLIQELDQDARTPALVKHRVDLAQADPQEALNTLSQVLGADGSDVPQMVALADGILVLDATDEQVKRIEALVPDIDVDPAAGVVQRTFELKHADPDQVREVVMSLVAPAGKAPARRTAPRKGAQKGQAPTAAPTPTPTGPSQEVTMVPAGRSLIVRAPTDKMEEIATLIAQLDVPEADKTEIRAYPIPPGVSVADVANSLTKLFGGRAVEARKGQGAAGRPTPGGITFIEQPAAHQLLVSAPTEDFKQIEETIQKLAVGGGVETVYRFIECHAGNAATLVSLVEPMLQAKLKTWSADGTLPEPPAGPKGQAQAQGLLTMEPDPRGDRIIIAAPQVVVAEAEALMKELDRPDEGGERVVRTVMLGKTDPEQMAQAIRSMLTGQQARPGRSGPPAQGGKPRAVPVSQPGGDMDVVVTAAPGGGAVVLSGPIRDVEVVEGWIKQLDEDAVGAGKIIKIYDLKDADVEQVADMLMAVVDGGAAAPGRQPPKPKKDEDLFADVFTTKITRQGKDLYITGNTFAGTMVVAATPAKMREVDDIVLMFVGTDEKPAAIPTRDEALPYRIYELKNVDAFDAEYTLESILDAIWPYEDKPKIEYIPFSRNLVIKGNPAHFDMVIELIEQYVDKGTTGPEEPQSTLTIGGTGMTAKDAALLLKAQMEASGVEVEVASASGEEAGEELEEIMPCIVPEAAFAAVRSAVGQQAQDEQPKSGKPKTTGEEPAAVDAAELLRTLAASQQPKGGAKQDAGGAGAQESPPAPKLYIYYDNEGGRLVLKGSAAAIDGAEEMVKSIKKELEKAPAPPDIRMFRLKYVSVTKAGEILDYMFNDRQRRAEQAQMMRLQQQMQQQRQRQRQQQQQGAQKGQQGQQGQRGEQPPGPQGQEETEAPAEAIEMAVTVYPIARDRSIIVKAAPEAFPGIIDLLKKIDRQSQAPMDYKIFTLQNNVASEVEEQLRAMLGQQEGRSRARTPSRTGRGQFPPGMQVTPEDMLQLEMPGGVGGAIAAEEITIASNATTNSIMVMAPQEAMELVERFINDMERLGRPNLVLRSYPLKYAKAQDTVTQLERLFQARGRGRGQPEGYDPTGINEALFAAEPRTNSIIVRALEVDLPKIEELLEHLDREGAEAQEVTIKTYALQHAQAAEVLRVFDQMVRQAMQQLRGSGVDVDMFSASADEPSNSLVVMGGPKTFALVEKVLADIDVPPPEPTQVVYQLQEARASDVATIINETLRSTRPQTRGGRVPLTVVANDALNSLVITATQKDYDSLVPLIKELDKKDAAMRDVHVLTLKYADAAAVNRSLNEVFARTGAGGRGPTVSISNPQGADTLLIKASDAEFAKIQEIVELLDTSEAEVGGEIKVIPLRYTDATETIEILKEYLRKPGGRGGPGGELAGDMRMSAAPTTNSLVISGNQEEIDHLAGIIAQIDVEVEDAVSAPKIIKLQYARASEIEPALTNLFSERTGGGGGRGGRGATAAPVIVADDSSNAIIVRASAVDYRQIENLVASMDTEEAGLTSEMKIVSLEPGVRAADMADMINDILEQAEQDRRGRAGRGGGGEAMRVLVSADVRTNSLILSGPKSRFVQIEELVRNLERLGPRGNTVSQVIRLENADPAEIQRLLDQVVEEGKSGTSGSKSRSSGRRR